MGIQNAILSQKENRHRKFAASISLIVGIILMLVKFWAFNLTQSQAVFSDALESIVNIIAAAVALFVIYYAGQPIDEDHPYGHGKIEFFSAAFEGGLIAFAAVFIMIEAVRAMMQDRVLHHLDIGIYIVLGAGLANWLLGKFLIYIGKKNGSIALKASGHHVISDFWTSLGVVGGLFLVHMTHLFWIDAVLAFIIGLYLAYTGVNLVKESIAGLMDQEDVEVLKKLAQIFSKNITQGIIQFHHVKVIRSGCFHHIDAHVVVPEFWTVGAAHDEVIKFESKVIKNYEFGGEMNFHLDPCRQVYCEVCDFKNCSIRKNPFKNKLSVNIEQLRSLEEPSQYRDPDHKG